MATLSSTIQNTIRGFLQSYVEAAQAKNPSLLSAYNTDDCVRRVGPASFLRSVGAPVDLTMTNSQYASEFGTFEFYTLDNHEVLELAIDVENRKVSVLSELTGTFVDGRKVSRTFVFFLTLTEDGSKISNVYQQNDTEEGRNFRLLVREYYDAKEKGQQMK